LHSSDSDEEQEEDAEFNAIYDNVSLERIQGLPRDKVNREMLTTQKCNSHLVDKVSQLKSENNRLKQLLQEHNIEFNKNASSNDALPLFCPKNLVFKKSTSRSSVESEDNCPTEDATEGQAAARSPYESKEEKS